MLRLISPRSFAFLSKLAACLLAAAAALHAGPAAACAGGEDCQDIQCESMFSPDVIGDLDDAPFFYSDRGFAIQNRNMVDEYRNSLEAANIEEWAVYLGAKLSTPELNDLLYKTSISTIDGLIFSLQGKNVALGETEKSLRAALSKRPGSAVKALYYLGFAKRVEPIATWRAGRDSWEAKDSDLAAADVVARADELVKGAQGLLKNAGDPFLEQRYHFQILRLLFYSDKYSECLAYYDAHKAVFPPEGSVKYRAMGLAAGSLYRLGQYSRADYLYSLIFDRYLPLKKSSFQSFHPQEEADWRQTLAQARSARETEVLWQMFGLYADGPAAIEKIHALDPKSDLLPLLLVHEVNKAEAEARFTIGRIRVDAEPEPARRVAPDLLAAVRKVADAGDALKPEVWHAALGHLLAMDGDSKGAEARLDLAQKTLGADSLAGDQVRMSLLFAKVRGLAAPESALEGYLAGELLWLTTPPNPRGNFLLAWSLNALSAVYEKGRQTVRSLMMADVPTADLYQDNAAVDSIVAFLKKEPKSDFDRFLSGRYGYDLDQLAEIKAINSVYAGRFAEAAAISEKRTGKAAADPLAADPFLIHIDDCHDCDIAAPRKTAYTRAAFFRRLDELERRSRGTGEEAARASFELANALYNMSYFGNARDVYTTGRGNFPPELSRNLDMGPAEKYYARALTLSSDREFQAMAGFMAAKAEHNRLYAASAARGVYALRNYFDRNGVPSGRWYELLRKSYSDTKYYAEILEECGYFKRWAESPGR
jgi:hypothetical protein